MKTKYIFISLEIRHGEYEFNSKLVHEISKRKSTDKFAEDYAKTFYNGKAVKYEKDGDWYNFDGGTVAVKLAHVEEITKEQYEVLNIFQNK
jgi:hypothetical protein